MRVLTKSFGLGLLSVTTLAIAALVSPAMASTGSAQMTVMTSLFDRSTPLAMTGSIAAQSSGTPQRSLLAQARPAPQAPPPQVRQAAPPPPQPVRPQQPPPPRPPAR
jgi:hypothetical protein